jgi:hypothetical protein
MHLGRESSRHQRPIVARVDGHADGGVVARQQVELVRSVFPVLALQMLRWPVHKI